MHSKAKSRNRNAIGAGGRHCHRRVQQRLVAPGFQGSPLWLQSTKGKRIWVESRLQVFQKNIGTSVNLLDFSMLAHFTWTHQILRLGSIPLAGHLLAGESGCRAAGGSAQWHVPGLVSWHQPGVHSPGLPGLKPFPLKSVASCSCKWTWTANLNQTATWN